MNKDHLTYLIKEEAKRLGFDGCGISRAEKLEDDARALEAWLTKNMHGEMGYMANYFDKRVDPRLLVDGAKSVISLTYGYYSERKQTDPLAPKIAMYAYGKDYHDLIRPKLNSLLAFIREKAGAINGRGFTDSAPVLDRAWARKSGLGWIGKNANLLTKNKGSYFFLAELIIDIELEYDMPAKDYCGNCTKCIDACPTGAIYEPYKVDGSKCISYFTIELKSAVIPESYKGEFENWMYGCDICQQVCPINTQAKPHHEPAFEPSDELMDMTAKQWEGLDEETYRRLFKGSPIKRAKFGGLKRNIRFLTDK